MRPPVDLTVIAALAVTQSAFGVLRALEWVRYGSDLFGRGLLVMPVVGFLAMGRGVLVAAIAVLYLVFAWAAVTRRRWAPGVGLAAAVLNLFAVVNVLVLGEAATRALPWAVVPVVLVVYLLSTAGRRAVGRSG